MPTVQCIYDKIPLRVSAQGVTFRQKPVESIGRLNDLLRPYGEIIWRTGNMPQGHGGLVAAEGRLTFDGKPVFTLMQLQENMAQADVVIFNGRMFRNGSTSHTRHMLLDESKRADTNNEMRELAHEFLQSLKANLPNKEMQKASYAD